MYANLKQIYSRDQSKYADWVSFLAPILDSCLFYLDRAWCGLQNFYQHVILKFINYANLFKINEKCYFSVNFLANFENCLFLSCIGLGAGFKTSTQVIHIEIPINYAIDLRKFMCGKIKWKMLLCHPLWYDFLHSVCFIWSGLGAGFKTCYTEFWQCHYPLIANLWQFYKSVIAKQCNGVAAEIVSSHARW